VIVLTLQRSKPPSAHDVIVDEDDPRDEAGAHELDP
jgi:hypothetical protein